MTVADKADRASLSHADIALMAKALSDGGRDAVHQLFSHIAPEALDRKMVKLGMLGLTQVQQDWVEDLVSAVASGENPDIVARAVVTAFRKAELLPSAGRSAEK